MQELRDRLAAEINKNEGLSMKLELSEKLRLESEIEKTGQEHSAGLDNTSDVLQGRVCYMHVSGNVGPRLTLPSAHHEPCLLNFYQKTLESELASMGAKFGAGITLDEDAGEQNDTESGKWSPSKCNISAIGDIWIKKIYRL